jgi:hypothetical protein
MMAIGANIGECAPITTDYIWRARDKGARLIVADPRFTPIARNADLYPAGAARHGPRVADGDAPRDHSRRPYGPGLHRGAHHGFREDRGVGGTVESAARRRGQQASRSGSNREGCPLNR